MDSIMEALRALVRECVRAEIAPLVEAVEQRHDVPKLLDRDAAATMLGISTRTLDELRGRGMPVLWVCDSPRFDRAAVMEWLAGQPSPMPRTRGRRAAA